jgi:hypothetical protein
LPEPRRFLTLTSEARARLPLAFHDGYSGVDLAPLGSRRNGGVDLPDRPVEICYPACRDLDLAAKAASWVSMADCAEPLSPTWAVTN